MPTPDLLPTPKPPPVGPRPTPLTIASVACILTAGSIGGLQLTGRAEQVPALLGTVSSWITAGSVTGILALLVWLQLDNRKLRLAEQKAAHDIKLADREADARDEADIRDHYAGELTTMRNRFDEASKRNAETLVEIEGKYRKLLQETEEHYKRLLDESDRAHEECKRDREALRKELSSIRGEMDGLRRAILSSSTERVLALGDPGKPRPSRAVHGAAKRVKRDHLGGADKLPRS